MPGLMDLLGITCCCSYYWLCLVGKCLVRLYAGESNNEGRALNRAWPNLSVVCFAQPIARFATIKQAHYPSWGPFS
jgi:hypothetical protein